MLEIQMLGRFAIHLDGRTVSDDDDRSRKVWMLLACLVYHRGRAFSLQELTELCWGEEERSSDPHNALKSLFHRVRAVLDKLEDGLGRRAVLRKAGCYSWDPELPVSLDLDQFEMHLQTAAGARSVEKRLAEYQKALDLYEGDMLPKQSAERWAIPAAAYYHGLYVQSALDTIQLLEAQGRLAEAVEVCRKAVQIEPYQEVLYQHLIRGLIQIGEQASAIQIYEDMCERFFSNFGILPSDELRALYREASRTVNDHTLSMDELLQQLQEEQGIGGAMICDYDFFQILYRAEARGIARSGNAVHLCLLSVSGKDGAVLPRRSMDRTMENLRGLIRGNLRRGDIATQCSVSQYAVMLPRANYENSCMVADRLVSAFCRRYPHSPARLTYTVQPLEPNV